MYPRLFPQNQVVRGCQRPAGGRQRWQLPVVDQWEVVEEVVGAGVPLAVQGSERPTGVQMHGLRPFALPPLVVPRRHEVLALDLGHEGVEAVREWEGPHAEVVRTFAVLYRGKGRGRASSPLHLFHRFSMFLPICACYPFATLCYSSCL